MAERHVPYDIEVEQAILGAMMVARQNYFVLTESILLRPEDFYDPLHSRIWEVMQRLFDSERSVSPLTMVAEIKSDSGFQQVGGLDYLTSLLTACPAMPNMRDYGRILRDLCTRRNLIAVGERIISAAYDPPNDYDAGHAADEAGELLYETAHTDQTYGGPEDLSEVIDRAIKLAETALHAPERARILTGMPTVDKALGGLFPRELTVLAAAPSQGKSGLGAQLGLHAAKHKFADIPVDDTQQGYATLVFSQEMSSEEWAMRYVAQESRVPANIIMEGKVNEQQFERVALSRNAFQGLPYKLDGSSTLKVAQMRARCQAMKRRLGRLDLVIVDHLQFVAAADDRADEKVQLKQITRDLKAIAKDLGCAVLLIAHLNRDFWKRASQRPVVSDIYGSSAIEQNADHIWFLHREEYYLERNVPSATDEKAFTAWVAASEKVKGLAEIFNAKRRMGPVGRAIVRFDGPLVIFTDPQTPPPPATQEARARADEPLDGIQDLIDRTGE